ncbi:hypothetical protein P9D31_14230 [Bacillus haynesii]|uniref:hypothetical protein n=1 Tax=Bacillus haynesii TaxID=1925021 RepID=UPI001593EF67|nr:hypothetical protein [Bacillus haynesii]MCY7815540.1 hypothetical protein [Bacillus haynesii]MCY8661738.1 hypothetical protein [Bacillus haynesii]MEC1473490.1 hypothetical protein [Bacillus haynesii]
MMMFKGHLQQKDVLCLGRIISLHHHVDDSNIFSIVGITAIDGMENVHPFENTFNFPHRQKSALLDVSTTTNETSCN